jgi:hypothetical protein
MREPLSPNQELAAELLLMAVLLLAIGIGLLIVAPGAR